MRCKAVAGFRTGDMVRAVVPEGKYAGAHQGVVTVRKRGYFSIRRNGKVVADGLNARYFVLIQRADGYSYSHERGGAAFSTY